MVNVNASGSNQTTSINVSSSTKTYTVKSANDSSQYYANLAKQWATSGEKVSGIDYSSKYYANLSKGYKESAEVSLANIHIAEQSALNEIETAKTVSISDINLVANTRMSEISTTASNFESDLTALTQRAETAASNAEDIEDDVIELKEQIDTGLIGYIKNLSDKGLTILGTPTTVASSINIGRNTVAGRGNNTVIGNGCTSSMGSNLAIAGYNASATNSYSTAIGGINVSAEALYATALGSYSHALNESSIQIGYGTNSTAFSLNIGFYGNNRNWQLLNGVTGLIPDARLSSNIARVSQIPSTDTFATKQWVEDKQYVTSSDLTNYVTNSSLATTLSDYVTNSALTTTLADYVTNLSLATTLTDYVTNSSLSTTLSDYALTSSLSTVARSGSYNDLSDKPYIPPGVVVDQTYDGTSQNAQAGVAIEGELSTNYQKKLVSGTNIKTVNNTSLLGSGNIDTSEIILIRESEATQYTYQEIHDLVWTSDKLAYYYKESSNLFFPFIGFDSNNSIIFGLPDIYISTTDHNGFKYVYIDTNSAWHIGFDDIEVKISGKVSKSGDTMTGGLRINDDKYSINGAFPTSTPSSNTYLVGYELYGNNTRLGLMGLGYYASGNTALYLQHERTVSGVIKYSSLQVGIDDSGNGYASCPKPQTNSDTNDIATTNWVNDKLYYRAGDKITSLSGYAVNGFLTSSKTRLNFTIPLPKSLDKVNGINITAMTISARQGAGGYVPADSWNAKANSTITTSFRNNMLHIECYSTSAFTSFTNNINVVVAFGTFTATFT